MRRIARLIKGINLDLKYKTIKPLNISTLKELTKVD